jgi:hypothetical protein
MADWEQQEMGRTGSFAGLRFAPMVFLSDRVHATRLMSFSAAKTQIMTGVHDIIADPAAIKVNKQVRREAAGGRSKKPSAKVP